MTWRTHLRADPLPWLLAADTPAVRAATLQRLLDLPAHAPRSGPPAPPP
jgi:CTP:molybdopterin cytidylyltransferase MocA